MHAADRLAGLVADVGEHHQQRGQAAHAVQRRHAAGQPARGRAAGPGDGVGCQSGAPATLG